MSKGGYSIQIESNKIGYVQVGHSSLTDPGKLKCKKIIHSVGPRWGEGDEEKKLSNAVYNSLKLADENDLYTISFPAVSSGIFGFPKKKCAEVMLNSVKKYLLENQNTRLENIIFFIIDQVTINVFKDTFTSFIKN